MKYSLNHVGNITNATRNDELRVSLAGDDGSQHNFNINVGDRDISSLTLKDIEVMAIEHARQSFANCN
ncbi:TPA: hypothetical protein L9302_000884 [Klebsiella aerogenes]|nr:hypothetical protein [Klebsiella aerogenes]HBR7226908.1 hypothetical protein [Klebsiella aerogenes]HBV9228299.1 hypothetical protein [Klebsiella aerogenes]HCM5461778.1 hypothetical protein [Klebsiella aerogenes]HCR0216519.1 hypothetical protein [Klebsiella aerogenes]